jgi:two-component system, cell cycle response regulator DivK
MGEIQSAQHDWQGKAILVVEDEDHNFAYIHEILKRTRVTILRAENGVKAVERAKKEPIDLVLMDIKLPEMDGLNATMEIRKILPEIPIIAQTAFAMEQERLACLHAGCDDYISKPFEPFRLLERVKRYLD